MRDFSHKLVPLLEDNIRVMIYAGDRDLICNWLGNRRWVDQLDWEGKQGWSQAQDQPWSVRGKQVGLVTNYDTLTFVKVFEAGHMVPMDQPAAALDMITRFMLNKNLAEDDEAIVTHAGGAHSAAAVGQKVAVS
jgi:carboxypeptidase C (cathepsin A)